ncbi:MAG: class I SAM-dependent methyltransferase [Janthinobacterium lividum]
MESLAFGQALQRCRCHFLPELRSTRRALVLGDGDGRFAEQLLLSSQTEVLALDASAAMLATLQQRCTKAGMGDRVTVQQADLAAPLPALALSQKFDLVTTHFFLDCLSEDEVRLLAARLLPVLTPDARWIVSEFHVPGNALRTPARLLIRSLYLAFRLLTGLKTQQMPPYGNVLTDLGLRRVRQVFHLRGLLVSEMWMPPRS